MSQTDIDTARSPIEGEVLADERALYRHAIASVLTKNGYIDKTKAAVKEHVPDNATLVAQAADDVTEQDNHLLTEIREWQDAINDDPTDDQYFSDTYVTVFERRMVSHWLFNRGVALTHEEALFMTLAPELQGWAA